jgi:hypothetical protein
MILKMIVYKTVNTINGKSYIGKYEGDNPDYLGSGVLLKKAIQKYGKSVFKRQTIEECTDRNNLAEREKYWINFFDAVNSKNYYNIKEGGIGGFCEKSHTPSMYSENASKRYGQKLKPPYNAEIGFRREGLLAANINGAWYLGTRKSISKNFNICGSEISRRLKKGLGSKMKNIKYFFIDEYEKTIYNIEGEIFTESSEIQRKYNISHSLVNHRCRKTMRYDWWVIKTPKEKYNNLKFRLLPDDTEEN